jgi:hypothetical protein
MLHGGSVPDTQGDDVLSVDDGKNPAGGSAQRGDAQPDAAG